MEGSDQKQTNTSDKENWMLSAQLWSQAGDPNKQQSSILPKSEADHNTFNNVGNCPKLGLDNKQRNGGAFLPFTKERSLIPNNSSIMALPDLALVSNEREMEEKKCTDSENGMSDNSNKISNVMVGKAVDSQSPTNTTTTPATPTSSQTHRKARRCWSPDLHRRFVNALQMLGGSQGTYKYLFIYLLIHLLPWVTIRDNKNPIFIKPLTIYILIKPTHLICIL